jgi:hypothetical protein
MTFSTTPVYNQMNSSSCAWDSWSHVSALSHFSHEVNSVRTKSE